MNSIVVMATKAEFDDTCTSTQVSHVTRLTAVMPVVIALEAARDLFDGQIDQ
jgi:hypothetical protein